MANRKMVKGAGVAIAMGSLFAGLVAPAFAATSTATPTLQIQINSKTYTLALPAGEPTGTTISMQLPNEIVNGLPVALPAVQFTIDPTTNVGSIVNAGGGTGTGTTTPPASTTGGVVATVTNALTGYPNVVLLGTTPTLQATVTDSTGNPMANTSVTFTISNSGISMYNGNTDYTPTATLGNNQSSDTVTTNANGVASVPLNLNLTVNAGGKTGLANQQIDVNAATYVPYTVTANGQSISSYVGFATFQNTGLSETNTNNPPLSPLTTATTSWLYPYGGANVTIPDQYARANEVSPTGETTQAVNVSAGYQLTLPQFTSTTTGKNGVQTIGLSGGVSNLNPNETNVYTDSSGKMQIPGNVNYATLNFANLGLSQGSAVTVYFVPTTGAAPTNVNTTSSYLALNGTTISSWPNANPLLALISGAWAKTFYVSSSTPISDTNFGVQIPTNGTPGTVYVVLKTPGQINPAQDTGYELHNIVMNYGSSTNGNYTWAQPPLNANVTWSPVSMQYSSLQPLASTGQDANAYSVVSSTSGFNSGWTVQYKVPLYPQVGDAIIYATDATGTVQKEWNWPTINNGSNQNVLATTLQGGVLTNVTHGQGSTTPSSDTLTQAGGVATVNATATGPQEIQGQLDLSGLGLPNGLINSLASNVYGYVQWTPLPAQSAPTASSIANNQYALAGQNVTITAQVQDVNGNPVETSGIPVKFYVATTSDGSVSVTANGSTSSLASGAKGSSSTVNTNANGQATLTLSASAAAGAVVQATAASGNNTFNVALSDAAGTVNPTTGLTQINFGATSLYYVPETSNFTPTETPSTTPSNIPQVVVGSQQNFGILPQVTWPSATTISVSPTNGGSATSYTTTNSTPIVNNLPFSVANASGSVGTVAQAQNTATTNSPATGITQWTATSTTVGANGGAETINVAPVYTSSTWNNVGLEDPSTNAPIVDAGTGLGSGINSMAIPLTWIAGQAQATISVPSQTAYTGASVPIYVQVQDVNGNAIPNATVNFTLTTTGSATFPETTPGTRVLLAQTTTNTTGVASTTLSGGAASESDQVTVTVTAPTTGTTILSNGQVNINWLSAPTTQFAVTAATPNLVANPNQITLTFNDQVNASTLNPNEFVVTDGSGTYVVQSAVVNPSNADQVILTLASSNATLPSSGLITVALQSYAPNTGVTYQVGDLYNEVASGQNAMYNVAGSDFTLTSTTTGIGNSGNIGTVTVPNSASTTYIINAPYATALTLKGGSSTTNVEIYAPLASVTNNSSGTFSKLTLADPTSFTNVGTITTLVDSQPGTTALPITNNGTITTTTISTSAPVTLSGSGSFGTVEIDDASAAITVGSGATITLITAAPGVTTPAGGFDISGDTTGVPIALLPTTATVTGATYGTPTVTSSTYGKVSFSLASVMNGTLSYTGDVYATVTDASGNPVAATATIGVTNGSVTGAVYVPLTSTAPASGTTGTISLYNSSDTGSSTLIGSPTTFTW